MCSAVYTTHRNYNLMKRLIAAFQIPIQRLSCLISAYQETHELLRNEPIRRSICLTLLRVNVLPMPLLMVFAAISDQLAPWTNVLGFPWSDSSTSPPITLLCTMPGLSLQIELDLTRLDWWRYAAHCKRTNSLQFGTEILPQCCSIPLIKYPQIPRYFIFQIQHQWDSPLTVSFGNNGRLSFWCAQNKWNESIVDDINPLLLIPKSSRFHNDRHQ